MARTSMSAAGKPRGSMALLHEAPATTRRHSFARLQPVPASVVPGLPRGLLWLLVAATLLTSGLGSVAALSQALGDSRAGRQIAARWCGTCHVTEPEPRARASDMSLSFSAIAAMPSTTEMSLRVFLQTPHHLMPDFQLSRQETDALIAYILSLRDIGQTVR